MTILPLQKLLVPPVRQERAAISGARPVDNVQHQLHRLVRRHRLPAPIRDVLLELREEVLQDSRLFLERH